MAVPGVKPDPEAPSFKDVLMQNLQEVNKLQQDATRATEDLQTGKRDDLEGVLLATQKADSAFHMLKLHRNIDLPDSSGETALFRQLTEQIRRGGERLHPGPHGAALQGPPLHG